MSAMPSGIWAVAAGGGVLVRSCRAVITASASASALRLSASRIWLSCSVENISSLSVLVDPPAAAAGGRGACARVRRKSRLSAATAGAMPGAGAWSRPAWLKIVRSNVAAASSSSEPSSSRSSSSLPAVVT